MIFGKISIQCNWMFKLCEGIKLGGDQSLILHAYQQSRNHIFLCMMQDIQKIRLVRDELSVFGKS